MANILNVWDGEKYIGIPVIKGDKPVKGVDYFTDDDKVDIVNEVLNSLPNSEEGRY